MSEGDRKETMRDGGLIALAWAVPALILSPFQDTPFVDDWVYSFSVERLLSHGELTLLEYTGNLNYVQVLWGALFCLPGGFSFSALRVSTWVLALACLEFLYLLLRELKVSRRGALLGVASLGVNPIFFILSFTFMTDIPFLAFMTGSAYTMARAVRTERQGWLMASSALACLATGVRVVGLALPVASCISLVLHGGAWGRDARRLLILLAPLLVFASFAAWHRGHTFTSADMSEVNNSPDARMRDLRFAIPLLPQMLPIVLAFAATHVGLAVLPLTVGSLRSRLFLRSCAAAALLGLALAVGGMAGLKYTLPLIKGNTWSLFELGASRGLVPGKYPLFIPMWACWLAAGLGWWSACAFAASWASRPVKGDRRCTYLAWLAAIHLLLMALLWLNYDRYALVLFPLGIALLLSCRVEPRPVPAMAVLAALGAVCLVGTRDHLRYNAAVWDAVGYLHRRGVPPSRINAGYVVNGWFQYAHPEDAPRDDEGEIQVIMVNASGSLDYEVSNHIPPDMDVLAEFPYPRWWGQPGRIYALKRIPEKGRGYRPHR